MSKKQAYEESVVRVGAVGKMFQKIGLKKESKVKVESECEEELVVFHTPLPLNLEEGAIKWTCITVLPKTKVVIPQGEEGAMVTVQCHRHDGYFTPYWQRRLTASAGYKLIVRPEKLASTCWTPAEGDAPRVTSQPLMPTGEGSGALEEMAGVDPVVSQRKMRMVTPNLPQHTGHTAPNALIEKDSSTVALSSANAVVEEGDEDEDPDSPDAPTSGGTPNVNSGTLLAPGRHGDSPEAPTSNGTSPGTLLSTGRPAAFRPDSGEPTSPGVAEDGKQIKEAACPVCKQPVYGSQPRTKNPADGRYYHMVCWTPSGTPGGGVETKGVEALSFPPIGRVPLPE